MTTIIEGMTPTEFITALNDKFDAVKSESKDIADIGVINASNYLTIISSNFTKIGHNAVAPLNLSCVSAGKKGKYLADNINNTFNTISGVSAWVASNYIALHFGAFIVWGLPAFMGTDAPPANTDPNTFAPTDLNIDQWLDACVSAGMTFVMLTVKTPDGFCLWPTSYHVTGHAPYSIAVTDWYANNGHIDIVKQFTDKARERGLKVGLISSIEDITYEARSGTDETTDAASYVAMIKAQLTELLTNYGEILALWFDVWEYRVGYEEITYAEIYNHIKSIQPNCILMENGHGHPAAIGQIEIYEIAYAPDGHVPANNTRACEAVETIRLDATQWAYHTNLDNTINALKSAANIKTERDNSIARNATYSLALQVDKTGHLTAAQIQRLNEIGA